MAPPILGFTFNNPDHTAAHSPLRLDNNSNPILSTYAPVMGKDLMLLSARFGLSNLVDNAWFFGISTAIWYEYTKPDNKVSAQKRAQAQAGKPPKTPRGPDLPVDLTLALLCRFYDSFPDNTCSINIRRPNLKLLGKLFDESLQKTYTIGEMLGRNKTASYRWMEGKAAIPTVNRLASALTAWLTKDNSEYNSSISQIDETCLPFQIIEKVRCWESLVIQEKALRKQP